MELDNDMQPQNADSIIHQLIEQNSQLRLEIATLRTAFIEIAQEFMIAKQMKESRNISPDILEKLSQLDIR